MPRDNRVEHVGSPPPWTQLLQKGYPPLFNSRHPLTGVAATEGSTQVPQVTAAVPPSKTVGCPWRRRKRNRKIQMRTMYRNVRFSPSFLSAAEGMAAEGGIGSSRWDKTVCQKSHCGLWRGVPHKIQGAPRNFPQRNLPPRIRLGAILPPPPLSTVHPHRTTSFGTRFSKDRLLVGSSSENGAPGTKGMVGAWDGWSVTNP